jgi:hypothetical protein
MTASLKKLPAGAGESSDPPFVVGHAFGYSFVELGARPRLAQCAIRYRAILRGHGLSADIESARRNCEAVLTVRPGFDAQAKPLNHRSKLPGALGGVNPNDQNAPRGQEVHKPVQCGLKRFDRVLSPLNEGNIILTAWKFAGCRGGDARIATAAQLKNPVRLLQACQYDSMINGTPSEFDHCIDNSID